MPAHRKHVKHRDKVIHLLRDYEPQMLGGTLTFPLLGQQVVLKKNVTTPGDHQSITPEVLARLAKEQKVGCTVSEWTPPPVKEFVLPKTETEAPEVSS